MGLGGGFDREWLEELDSEGNTDMSADGIDEATVGCHVGKYRGLNVINPLPGCEYVWMLDPNVGGNTYADRSLEIRMSGGEIVQNDDTEMAAYQALLGDQGITEVSGYVSNGEVCLVRFPEEAVRERRDTEFKRAQTMIRGKAESDYVAGATYAETLAGHGKPTRFASFRHSTEFQDGAALGELHTPDTGITKDNYDPSGS